MKITKIFLAFGALLMSYHAFSMAQWNRVNSPGNMVYDYERSFNKLPRSADLTTTPWSGDYWPTYKGGISYRWNQLEVSDEVRWSYDMEDISNISIPLKELSPAEKYDLYLGNKGFPLTTYERDRTKIFKTVKSSELYEEGYEIPTWEGICESWAPATLYYRDPGPFTVTGANGEQIPFGSSDMKALLSYHVKINEPTKTRFLGSRCNLDFAELRKKQVAGSITKAELEEKINSSACADTNAGAFHIVLTNQIGLRDKGFMIDMTRDLEVWNQPVTGYSFIVYKVTDGASSGAAPGTVQEVWVRTTLKYIGEIPQSFELFSPSWRVKNLYYDYRLELNKDEEIIGGAWNSEERPDFIWKNQPKEFKGYFKALEKLYKKSIAYLNPSKYTDELKSKFKKLGKIELIKKNFVQQVKISATKNRALQTLKKDYLKKLAVTEFKESGKRSLKKRINARIELLKKESRRDFLTKGFIKNLKGEVRKAHIENAKNTFKKKHKRGFLRDKFIEGAKEIVRDTHIRNAKEVFKAAHRVNFLKANFVKEVRADAKKTRRNKEMRKARAKAEVLSAATNTFLAKKFISAVSKDAKETRNVKEENKKVAKAKLAKKITQDFITNKFITEVIKDAKKTRSHKERRKAAAKQEVMKQAKNSFLTKKFVTEVKKDALKNKIKKQKIVNAVKSNDSNTLRVLLKSGIDVNFTNRESGLTPLMIAAKSRNLDVVHLLISKISQDNLDSIDREGQNALILAITGSGKKPNKDVRKIVKLLVKAGINLKRKDKKGLSALDYVSIRKYRSRRISIYLKFNGA